MKIKLLGIQKNVEKKTSHGIPYTTHIVEYVDISSGETKQKMIFTNEEFVKEFPNLVADKEYDIQLKKDGKYWKWVGLKKAGSSYNKPNTFKKTNFNELGMRVGNITTNATAIYCAMLAKTFEEAVDKVIGIQDLIEKKLTTSTSAAAAPKSIVEAVDLKPLEDDLSEWEIGDDD